MRVAFGANNRATWAGLAAGIVIGAAGGWLAVAGPRDSRAQDAKPGHAPAAQAFPKGVKAPIEEVLHCPLAFEGLHLLKELPEYSQVAYHYCKSLNDDVTQCVLYDGKGPNARLIGIEYLVTDAIYQKMPAEEKAYWHDHQYEVDAGLLDSLTQDGEEEQKTLKVVRTLWGKVFHTWATGKTYPMGPPKLFWAVTGKPPFELPSRKGR